MTESWGLQSEGEIVTGNKAACGRTVLQGTLREVKKGKQPLALD